MNQTATHKEGLLSISNYFNQFQTRHFVTSKDISSLKTLITVFTWPRLRTKVVFFSLVLSNKGLNFSRKNKQRLSNDP